MDIRIDSSGTAGAVVTVAGEVDLSTVEPLARALREAAGTVAGVPEATVTVDLSAVSFLDSSGVRALLQGRTAASAAGATLRIRDPQAAVRRVLEIAGVDQVLGLDT